VQGDRDGQNVDPEARDVVVKNPLRLIGPDEIVEYENEKLCEQGQDDGQGFQPEEAKIVKAEHAGEKKKADDDLGLEKIIDQPLLEVLAQSVIDHARSTDRIVFSKFLLIL
jgi:hypothetical protein